MHTLSEEGSRFFSIYMRFLPFIIQVAVNTAYLYKRPRESTEVQRQVGENSGAAPGVTRGRKSLKGEASGHQPLTPTLLGGISVPELRSQGHPRAPLPPGSAPQGPHPPAEASRHTMVVASWWHAGYHLRSLQCHVPNCLLTTPRPAS